MTKQNYYVIALLYAFRTVSRETAVLRGRKWHPSTTASGDRVTPRFDRVAPGKTYPGGSNRFRPDRVFGSVSGRPILLGPILLGPILLGLDVPKQISDVPTNKSCPSRRVYKREFFFGPLFFEQVTAKRKKLRITYPRMYGGTYLKKNLMYLQRKVVCLKKLVKRSVDPVAA